MAKALIVLAPGFEEGETVEIIDVLRRSGFSCDSMSIAEALVSGAHDIKIEADYILNDDLTSFFNYDMLILPGGWSGVDAMLNDSRVLDLVRYYNKHGKFVAAMCAAPNVLAKAGVLTGKTMTAYPGQKTEPFYSDAHYVNDVVVKDGNLITSRGPATALPFAFALVDVLGGDSSFIKKRFLYQDLKNYPDGTESVILKGEQRSW